MKPRPLLAAALLGVPLLLGCGKKPAEDEASIRKSLEEKGTIDLMDQVAKAPDYPPPADGRLTERQVKMYLDVRERELRIREVAVRSLKSKGEQAEKTERKVSPFEAMKALGDLADLATADLRAAQELGHNPKEFQWVKERVLEAQMLATTEALDRQVAEGRKALVATLEEQRRAATDETQRAELDRRLAELRTSAAESVSGSHPGSEYNAGLLSRHQERFARLQAEDERIAKEMESGGR
jgi:uncharacterized protein YecT (DUF1311 family)